MARFVGTSANDIITPALISAGVVTTPPGADLSGDDRIFTLSGNDRVEGDSGNDFASLGDGSDRFIWNPGDGDDIVNGGAGIDTLEFNGDAATDLWTVTTLSNGGFRFFRELGDITVDTIKVERVEVNSGDGDDIIDASGQTSSTVDLVVNAGNGRDIIVSGEGDDQIVGAVGNDVAFGLSGDDRFIWDPGDGDDVFNGGSGTDTLEFNGSDDAELMTITTRDNGGFRFFRDLGDITVDTISVEQVEVQALGGNDTIDGSAQTRSGVALRISGGTGDDTMTGGAGDDTLSGNAGDDTLAGGTGDDSLIGGSDADTLIVGEESSNNAVETDVIRGYVESDGDVVDLSGAGGFIDDQVVAGNLRLTLGGGDDDILIIRGVADINDVTFL